MVHNFGGPIGLTYALEHPERIRGLVIMNSWMWSPAAEPRYRTVDRLFRGPLGRWLYLNLNISPRLIMPAALADRASLPAPIHRHYLAPFPTSQSRRALHAYARALIGSSDFYQALWDRREAIADVPTLIVWGMKDPAFRVPELERMTTIFRRLETVRLEHVGHFPQEEAPAAVLTPLEAFLERVTASTPRPSA